MIEYFHEPDLHVDDEYIRFEFQSDPAYNYSGQLISEFNVDAVVDGRIWISISPTNPDQNGGAYDWIDVESAEKIAMAILAVVKFSKGEITREDIEE